MTAVRLTILPQCYNLTMTEHPLNYFSADHNDIAEVAMEWFVKIQSTSLSPAERMRFNSWYQSDPLHRQLYNEIVTFWENPGFSDTLSTMELSPDVKRLLVSRDLSVRRFRYLPSLIAIAASVFLIMFIYQPNMSCWQADYCTAMGEIKTVTLNDGSLITLNSASAVQVNLSNSVREVKLKQGAVFCDVKRDAQHPFLVNARYSNTRVLGTRFVVKEGHFNDNVTVLSGVVEVSRNHQNPVILNANDSITVDSEQIHEIENTPTLKATSWINGAATFDNATLSEVITEIGHYRRGSIIIKNKALNSLKVSGRFDILDTDNALKSLQETLSLRVYRLTPWLVLIS